MNEVPIKLNGRVSDLKASYKLVSYVLTVSKENTDEWMDGLVGEINQWAESVGETDRVARSRIGLVIVRSGERKEEVVR